MRVVKQANSMVEIEERMGNKTINIVMPLHSYVPSVGMLCTFLATGSKNKRHCRVGKSTEEHSRSWAFPIYGEKMVMGAHERSL